MSYISAIANWLKKSLHAEDESNLKAPIYTQLELTDKCNLYCQHCYRFDSEKIRQSFDLEDRKIMSFAKKIVSSGVFTVILTGGEPFTRKELLLKLVKYFKKKNVSVSINTNLLLADEKTVAELEKLKLNGFLVSCVSSDPETYRRLTGGGDLEKFKENLKMIHSHGFNSMISMVVTKENLKQVRQTAMDLKEFGIRGFAATPMSLNIDNPRTDLLLSVDEVGQVAKDLIWIQDQLGLDVNTLEPLPICALPKEVLHSKYKFLTRKCYAGKNTIAVSNTGEVKPCPHIDKSYGNLLKEPLCKIYSKMSDWKDSSHTPDECKQCKVLYKCGGGCRANAKAYDGSFSGKGPWFAGQIERDIFKRGKGEVPRTVLDKDTTLIFSTNYRWRKEGKDRYTIMIRDSIKYIDSRTFRLLKVLKKFLPMRVADIAKILSVSVENEDFMKDILFLCRQEIIRTRNSK